MTTFKFGLGIAAREHLLEGKPITRLEAVILYGVANLPDLIKDLRSEGWIVKSQRVPYAVAARRVNEYAVFEPPKNLPIKEIQFTEYWVSR